MNRLDRLQAILIHLQSKKVVTAQEIADRFAISIRTVYRDIRSLEEAGVPVGAEAGVGYFLTDNYHLPPVMFTNREASALLFGSKFVEQHSDTETKESFESALFKIKAVLRSDEKEHIDILHKYITVYGRTATKNQSENLFLHDIQNALVENRKLFVQYTAANSGDETCRTLVPITLCFYGMQWHLIAFCELRNAYRDFRLDRLGSVHISDDVFDRSEYKTIDEYFESINLHEHAQHIIVSMSQDAARHIREYKYWYGFTHQTEFPEGVEMHFFNNDIDGFARWILYGGGQVKIIQPLDLKQKVVDLVTVLKDRYL